jgi:hypothetical protein
MIERVVVDPRHVAGKPAQTALDDLAWWIAHPQRHVDSVMLSHDPHPPVIRRKMAFHNALFGDVAQVEDIVAHRVDDGVQVLSALRGRSRVLVAWLGHLDLLPIRQIDVRIDARLQKMALPWGLPYRPSTQAFGASPRP